MKGNKEFVNGKGTGKVVESSEYDNIFVFFSDHGAANLIAFPTKYLYANTLIETFQEM